MAKNLPKKILASFPKRILTSCPVVPPRPVFGLKGRYNRKRGASHMEDNTSGEKPPAFLFRHRHWVIRTRTHTPHVHLKVDAHPTPQWTNVSHARNRPPATQPVPPGMRGERKGPGRDFRHYIAHTATQCRIHEECDFMGRLNFRTHHHTPNKMRSKYSANLNAEFWGQFSRI